MNIGLLDCDKTNYPNLALMKISAYHKAKGDNVEWLNHLMHYDKVYVSKVFGDEYKKLDLTYINADEIEYGGTGFAIAVKDGKEIFLQDKHKNLPYEIEHIYPDYELYGELTKDIAYGFLTRGCPNNCPFCIVSKKEGLVSRKVADLSEFYRGQKNIDLLDPNILACKEHMDLLKQIRDTHAKVNFNQGLDARFINESNIEIISQIKLKMIHFAFDFMKNEKRILKGLELAKKHISPNIFNSGKNGVYILTNYDTTFEEDMYRIRKVVELGYRPYVMIYRKDTASQQQKDLQRWANNRYIFTITPDFMDYIPRSDGKRVKSLIKEEWYTNRRNKQ